MKKFLHYVSNFCKGYLKMLLIVTILAGLTVLTLIISMYGCAVTLKGI
jgi:hypothetical protein